MERRSLFGRTKILAVPETGHIELAIGMTVSGVYLLAIIEINSIQGRDDNVNTLLAIFINYLTGNNQWQLLGRLASIHTVLLLLKCQ